jgi:hypothetical protein
MLLEDSLRQQCKKIKYLDTPPTWVETPDKSHCLKCSANFLDESRLTVPGIRLEVVYSKRKETNLDVYFYKLLMKIDSGKWVRAFAVEVYPDTQRSHCSKDGKDIFGSHMHYADGLPFEKVRSIFVNRPDNNDERYYKRFIKHIHLVVKEAIGIDTPWQDDLFSEVLA